MIHPADLALDPILHRKDPIDGDEWGDLFFQASRFDGEPHNLKPGKCIGLKWAASGDMKGLVDYVQHALDHIDRGAAYAEFGE